MKLWAVHRTKGEAKREEERDILIEVDGLMGKAVASAINARQSAHDLFKPLV